VVLVCEQYNALLIGSGTGAHVFPDNLRDCFRDGTCPSTIDGCGNFQFDADMLGTPQFDGTYFCMFVANRPENSPAAPQSCNGKQVAIDDESVDPTQSGSCTGGLCPNAP
jgi:hypothetical protein